MSQKTTETPVVEIAPEAAENETKQSALQKTTHFLKSHKRPAIAVGALLALVGAAAVSGRKTATVTVQSPIELEIVDEETEVTETQSA